MSNYFDTGIQLTAGFSLSGQAPLDGRSVVELLTDLDTHVAENRAYEGMEVYVKENKKIYIFNGTTWDEFVGGGGSSEKQIKDWVSGSSYLEGDYIYHEGEIYRCLTSNSDADFDEANWIQVTYGIDELSKEDVERLLGLTEEELEAMASLISDTEVRIDKTYSSSKIYTDIQQCLEDSKTYTLEEIARAGTASYKVVTDVVDMTEERYLYLLYDGATNYDIYIVETDGTPTKIGNTQIDLSNYYTKTEIDNDFLKKVDADSKYATITTVDGKIDKDKIVTALDGTVTDEQVPSARIVVDELGLKANDSEVVKKTDIATTIDLSSTDEQVASAKAVYDGLENINDFSVQVVKENLDLNDITETGIYFFPQAYTPVNIPVGVNGWLLVMKGSSSDIVKQVWYRLGTANSNSYNTFERYKGGNTWSGWTKFLTEKEYYNALDYGNPVIPQDADLNDYLTPGVYTCMSSTIANTLVNCPHIDSNFKLIVNRNRGNSDIFYGYQMIVGTVGGNPVTDVCVYYRGISMYDNVCVFSKWKIMSGSTVADVPVTTITTSNLSSDKITAGVVNYCVKNGVCYVYLEGIKCSEVSTSVSILENMPKALITSGVHAVKSSSDATSTQYCFIAKNETTLKLHCFKAGDTGYCSFSYPISEE